MRRLLAAALLAAVASGTAARSLEVVFLPESGRALVRHGPTGLAFHSAASSVVPTFAPPTEAAVTRDDAGRIASVAIAGNTYRFRYVANALAEIRDEGTGRRCRFTYNAEGHLATVAEPEAETTMQYDAQGRVTLIGEDDVTFRVAEYGGTAGERIVDLWDTRRGHTTYRYTRDAVHIVEAPLRGAGGTTTRVDRVTGRRTIRRADGGRVTVEPSGGLWTVAATLPGQVPVVSTLAADGRVVDARTDAHRYRVMTADAVAALPVRALQGQDIVEQDAAGRPLKVYGGGEVLASYTYDDAGRLVRVALPGGTEHRFSYDTAGRVAAYADAARNVTRLTYAPGGRALTVARPGVSAVTMAFDAEGRMTRRKGPGDRELVLEYGPDGRAAAVRQVGFDSQREDLYEDSGEVFTSYTSEVFGHWFFLYPKHETTATRIAPGGGMTFYTLDDAHRLLRVENGTSEELLRYTYDTAGNVILAHTPDTEVARKHDTTGQLTGEERRDLGLGVTYTYDDAGRVASVTGGDGHALRYAYDALGRVTSVRSTLAGAFTFAYGTHGLLGKLTRPNGVTTTCAYDSAGRLERVTHAAEGAGNPLATFTVRRDGNGRCIGLQGGGAELVFTFDRYGQAAVRRKDPDAAGAPAYDAWGNLQRRNDYTVAYERPGRPREAGGETVACDDAGRLVRVGERSFTYDWEGRLAAVEEHGAATLQLRYDGFGRLAADLDATGAARHHVYALGRPYALAAAGRLRRYVFAPGIDRCLAVIDFDGTVRYPLRDPAGEAALTADAEGKVVPAGYDERGLPRGASDGEGALGYRGGFTFLGGDLLCLDGRTYLVTLNRALAADSPQPFASALRTANPLPLGLEQPPRVPRQELALP